jgi:hypothetical protein
MRLDEKDKVVGIAFVSADMINGDEPVPEEKNGAE